MRAFAAFSVLLVFTGQALATTTTTGNFFDCRRAGITCADGTCDPSTFVTCSTCNAGFTAVSPFVCMADANAIGECGSPPAVNCQNGASCKQDSGGNEICYCDDNWTGTLCDVPRIQPTCNVDDMVIVVTPWTGTTTLGYPEGKIGVTACAMAYAATPNTQTATYNYDNSDTCGMVKATETNGDLTYTISVIIQYTADYVQYTDQKLTAKCTFSASGTATSSFTADAAGTLNPGTGDAAGTTPLSMAVIDPGTSSAPSTPVVVGTELNLVITFDSTHPASNKILVQTCTVGSMATDDNTVNYKSIDIVDSDGCPSENPGVVRGDHTTAANTVTIPFYAFMFIKESSSNTGTLYFSCTVKLCSSGTLATCDAPSNCPATYTTGYGRRKRSAEGGAVEATGGAGGAGGAGAPEVQQLTQSIKVRIGNATLEAEFGAGNAGAQGAMDKANECLQNPQMQTVLAVLGLLLVLAVVALTATAVLYCRGRGNQDSRLKYVDNYAMGSSTQTLAMPKI